MKCWHVLMTGRELQHSCLQGWSPRFRLGTSASCSKDLKLSRLKYRTFWSRLFRVFEQWEKWNWYTIGILHIFLPYVMKSTKEYMGQCMGQETSVNVSQKREKTSLEVLRFSQSSSSIPASLLSFYICDVTMATMKTFYNIWAILTIRNCWMGWIMLLLQLPYSNPNLI